MEKAATFATTASYDASIASYLSAIAGMRVQSIAADTEDPVSDDDNSESEDSDDVPSGDDDDEDYEEPPHEHGHGQ